MFPIFRIQTHFEGRSFLGTLFLACLYILLHSEEAELEADFSYKSHLSLHLSFIVSAYVNRNLVAAAFWVRSHCPLLRDIERVQEDNIVLFSYAGLSPNLRVVK